MTVHRAWRAVRLPGLAGFAVVVLSGGCGPYTIAVTPTLDKAFADAITTNATEEVAFSFSSGVADTVLIAHSRDKQPGYPEHPGYKHQTAAAMGDMLSRYMRRKFSRLGPPPRNTTIRLSLDKLHIEQYPVDGYGNFVSNLSLSASPIIEIAAVIEATLTVAISGEFTVTKKLSIESTDRFGRAVGPEPSEKALYEGETALQQMHAANLTAAANELVGEIDAYLKEIGF